MIDTLVIALRGAAAIVVLTTLAGGIPRLVQLGLAATFGLWAALVAGAPNLDDGLWIVAARELVIGATIGLVAALPLIAAAFAGRLVDLANGAATRGPYRTFFAIIAAAVFVGIDGHVVVVTTLVESYRDVPAIATPQAIASLFASAVTLSIPWLVTAAVVEIAVGVGMRLAGRAGSGVSTAAAVPAALAMMTAALVATFAVAFAVLVRSAS